MTEQLKVKCTRINAYAVRLSKARGVCMTSQMVKRLDEPPKIYCEIDSLLSWMRATNEKYNGDDFVEKENVADFIHTVEGSIKELADEKRDIEWL